MSRRGFTLIIFLFSQTTHTQKEKQTTDIKLLSLGPQLTILSRQNKAAIWLVIILLSQQKVKRVIS